jgi:hypothetical protein
MGGTGIEVSDGKEKTQSVRKTASVIGGESETPRRRRRYTRTREGRPSRAEASRRGVINVSSFCLRFRALCRQMAKTKCWVKKSVLFWHHLPARRGTLRGRATTSTPSQIHQGPLKTHGSSSGGFARGDLPCVARAMHREAAFPEASAICAAK